MKTRTRSPFLYGAGGCVLGVVVMVCAVATMGILGPAVFPLSEETASNLINIGSWMVPIGLGLLGFIWGKRKQVD